MQTYELTPDSKAILLLCGVFKSNSPPTGFKPLTITEYHKLATALRKKNMRPGDMLEESGLRAVEKSPEHNLAPERLRRLLERGAALAFAVEEWMNKGIWIVTRSDEEYPAGIRQHLGKQRPPILFGVGDRNILKDRGLAVVGSRNVDAEGEIYTREVGTHCGTNGILIVSGGARGVDQIAMTAALQAGGGAVGVLANNLLRTSVSGDYREAIQDQRLLLLSPYHPDARFTVGNAMGRNKYIYALSRCALIISTDYGKGGTWAGAVEELKRQPHIPVFVRYEGAIPTGNKKLLLKKGTARFPERPWNAALLDQLEQSTVLESSPNTQHGLFDTAVPAQKPEALAQTTVSPHKTEFEPAAANTQKSPTSDFYTAILPILLNSLQSWTTLDQLLEQFEVRKGQLQDWLKKAIQEGKIEKKTGPTSYRRIQDMFTHQPERTDKQDEA